MLSCLIAEFQQVTLTTDICMGSSKVTVISKMTDIITKHNMFSHNFSHFLTLFSMTKEMREYFIFTSQFDLVISSSSSYNVSTLRVICGLEVQKPIICL
jgi:hypothetical protein